MAADAAGELRGYTDPADPFPWELTEDDHRAILPRLHHAIADLAVCIDGIARATGDEHAKRQLAEGIGRLLSGCAHVSAATAALSFPGKEPDAEPVITTQPAQLSAADFPAARAPGSRHARAAGTRAGRRDLTRADTRIPPASGQFPAQVERSRSAPTHDLRHVRYINLIQNSNDQLSI